LFEDNKSNTDDNADQANGTPDYDAQALFKHTSFTIAFFL
jgi:hypothetical protein